MSPVHRPTRRARRATSIRALAVVLIVTAAGVAGVAAQERGPTTLGPTTWRLTATTMG